MRKTKTDTQSDLMKLFTAFAAVLIFWNKCGIRQGKNPDSTIFTMLMWLGKTINMSCKSLWENGTYLGTCKYSVPKITNEYELHLLLQNRLLKYQDIEYAHPCWAPDRCFVNYFKRALSREKRFLMRVFSNLMISFS